MYYLKNTLVTALSLGMLAGTANASIEQTAVGLGTPVTASLGATQVLPNGAADLSGLRNGSASTPHVMLVADESSEGHSGMAMDQGKAVTIGALELSAPFSRATLPNQPVAGGFMTITNTGDTDDTLVGARSDAAARMEVHEMAMQGEVMKMRELENGLPIPAGETVMLKPGGFHIMFMDLAGPFAEGDTVTVTLVFEKAGEVTLTMPVVARGGGAGHGGSAGHGMASE